MPRGPHSKRILAKDNERTIALYTAMRIIEISGLAHPMHHMHVRRSVGEESS